MSVSRETVPDAPGDADKVFGMALMQVRDFAELLAGEGTLRGLIGPREIPRLWQRHLINCGVVANRIETDASVADVGSGAGLPGIVWAIMRPDLRITLIEPLLRRTTFLDEIVDELSLSNVTVVRGRAENLTGGAGGNRRETSRFDVVTARAVARLEKLAAWTMPLVKDEGLLLAFKGEHAAVELDEARAALRGHGATSMSVTCYETLDVPTRVVEVRK